MTKSATLIRIVIFGTVSFVNADRLRRHLFHSYLAKLFFFLTYRVELGNFSVQS